MINWTLGAEDPSSSIHWLCDVERSPCHEIMTREMGLSEGNLLIGVTFVL